MDNISEKIKEYIELHNLSSRYHEIIDNMLKDEQIVDFMNKNNIKINSTTFKKSVGVFFEFYNRNKDIKSEFIPKLQFENGITTIEYCPTNSFLEKQRQIKQNRLFHLLYLPENIKNYKFSDFDQNGRRSAYLNAIKFADNLIGNPTNFYKGPYFYGQFGVGKTFLLGAIASDLASHEIQTEFVHVPTLVVELKNSIGNNSLSKLINEIRNASVLILDDIGAESLSSWVRDDIFNPILQFRMDAKMPTLFSSNFNLSELEKHLTETRDDYDPVKARRIIERIRFLSSPTEISGKNWRE